MSQENEIHVGCDKWIISEYMLELEWAGLAADERDVAVAEFVEAEKEGYELPEDYSPACARWYFFVGLPENDVLLGFVCGNRWIDPLKLARNWLSLMPTDPEDDGYANAIKEDGICVVHMTGRSVTHAHMIAWTEVRNG